MRRQAKRQAKRADLVLKEVIERLDKIKAHALGERNQIVVALDGRGLAARLACTGLDDVGVMVPWARYFTSLPSVSSC